MLEQPPHPDDIPRVRDLAEEAAAPAPCPRSIAGIVLLWIVFLVVLGIPFLLALPPETRRLAYVADLDLPGWAVLAVVTLLWFLLAGWCVCIIRTCWTLCRSERD